jgi:hypothetical protein
MRASQQPSLYCIFLREAVQRPSRACRSIDPEKFQPIQKYAKQNYSILAILLLGAGTKLSETIISGGYV